MRYDKTPTTIEQQMELLRSRGMEFSDPEAARFYLAHIGYYRLRGYWIPFEDPANPDSEHRFRPGTRFDQILNLYTFDRELRLLVTDAIERIEVSVRNQWVDVLAHTHGAHAYLDSNLFGSLRRYGRNLSELAGEFEKSKEACIRHYKKKYREPDLPPIWAAVSIMTLGQFSHWLSNLKSKSLKSRIAKVYGLDESVLTSFLHHLTVIRNLCAHHSRLWNLEVTLTMELPRSKPPELVPSLEYGPNPNQPPRKIYNTLVMLAYMMDRICPGHHWKHRLKCLLRQHEIDMGQMGFPGDFAERPMWASTWGAAP